MFLNIRYQVRYYFPTLITKLILLYLQISALESPAITIDILSLKLWKYLISLQKCMSTIVSYPQALIKDRFRYSCDNNDKQDVVIAAAIARGLSRSLIFLVVDKANGDVLDLGPSFLICLSLLLQYYLFIGTLSHS